MVTVHNRTVSEEDIRRVIDAAQVLIPNDREVLHILPQEFIVDEQDGVQNPLEMAAALLEVKFILSRDLYFSSKYRKVLQPLA